MSLAWSPARWAKTAVLYLQHYLLLVGQVCRGLVTRPIYVRDIIEQLDIIGIGSLTVVIMTGLFTGMVLALQTGMTLDRFGARSVVGQLVSASMLRELGPVLTALMVTGRVGSGIAAELGSMVVTEQISALRSLGTDPIRKLVVPRVVAGSVMVPVLTVVSDAVGMVGGMIISVTQLRVAASIYWANVYEGLWLRDIGMGLIKPLMFGFALVSIGCFLGLRAHGGTQGVGRATTQAVVAASVVILALDFLITKFLMAVAY